MEKKMETTIISWDNGKENGNYDLGFRVWGLAVPDSRVCSNN